MTDEVARILRDRIVRGELPAGSRLELATLAIELGVSRTPIREAILQLETAGLVQRQPYRGTVVAGVDPLRLEEVTALRIDLEGRAALLGVPRLTDDDVARMTAILDELEARHDDEDLATVFNELNRAFHDVLYRAAGAPVLTRLIETLGAEADRIRLHFDLRSPLAEVFHRQILAACRDRDADAAARATRLHLLESYFGMRNQGRDVTPGILADVLHEQGIVVPE
ncbi:MAG: GntR family transcriptional regulator [Microbacterium sp.]|uniref:GntR family transcriptional regulator n=1 Tax=Microbacterium sp. TaxID=51671 RepID=UPI00262F57FE|nr:GntR family transcriptional regulator [Microbacterium sp.]MCX6502490.1 GntR family transcriptional regulator [Microbacterium sp.]